MMRPPPPSPNAKFRPAACRKKGHVVVGVVVGSDTFFFLMWLVLGVPESTLQAHQRQFLSAYIQCRTMVSTCLSLSSLAFPAMYMGVQMLLRMRG
jgi:hypothetical protein